MGGARGEAYLRRCENEGEDGNRAWTSTDASFANELFMISV